MAKGRRGNRPKGVILYGQDTTDRTGTPHRSRDRINLFSRGWRVTDDVIPSAVELRVLNLDFGQVGFGNLDAGGVDVGIELAKNFQ